MVDEGIVGIQNPVFVTRDIKRKNEMYRDLWTVKQQTTAATLSEFIYSAYGCRPRVFVNYRKGHIAIKVCGPKPAEKNLDLVKEFNRTMLPPNAVKEVPGGVLYVFCRI